MFALVTLSLVVMAGPLVGQDLVGSEVVAQAETAVSSSGWLLPAMVLLGIALGACVLSFLSYQYWQYVGSEDLEPEFATTEPIVPEAPIDLPEYVEDLREAA